MLQLPLLCGLCMTVPCLEASQDSCRAQTGVIIVLSVVMEESGGEKLGTLHPIHFLVLVFKENISQPVVCLFRYSLYTARTT